MKKASRKVLSLALTLALLLGLPPGAALAADAPVQIGTAQELADFRDRVNAGENTLDAVLTADIQLTGEWTPFNPASSYVTDAYAGVFDGGGHTISGLSINATATNQGLFGVINGATIQNLTVVGDVSSSKAYVGGIVGKIQQGTVENCGFFGSVATTATGSSAYAGGIAGYTGNTATQTATIQGCVNAATVTGGVAGGIVGYAKYTTIESCYNTGAITGGSRSGGIAGQLQNNCAATYCYNLATVSGSATAADICDFLYSSASLSHCYYQTALNGAGTGTAADCEPITTPADLLDKLGSSFVADDNSINSGYPILAWQAGEPPAPKDPHITIHGATSLYMTNSGAQPTATLTVSYEDMDDAPAVEWSIASGGDVVSLTPSDNAGVDNASVIVQALAPGYATIQATAGEYSNEVELTVWPFVTTVEIKTALTVEVGGQEATVELSGAAAGHRARACINVGGEELDYDTFPVTVQWKYLPAKDYDAGNTGSGSYKNISGETGLTYDVPEELEGDYLSFTFRYQNEDKTPNRTAKVRSADKAAEEAASVAQREQAAKTLREALDACVLYPVWGEDANVARTLEGYLERHGLPGYTATVQSVKEVYGGAGIADNGDITYFYADPNTAPSVRMGSYKVTFTVTNGADTVDKELSVIVYWDVDKVKAVMGEEILSQVELDTSAPVSADLSLPKTVDGKRWTLISWQSSDPAVISVSSKNQTTADTLFDPYVGVVTPGETAQEVTLTAAFTFQLTNDVGGQEAPIVLYKTFIVTVPAMDEVQAQAIRQELLAKLDQGFEAKGLTDAVTGARLEPNADGVYTAIHDIQLPTTRDFGVDGKEYPITITSGDQAVIQAPDVRNAARVSVCRPGPGREDETCVLTVTIADRDTSVTASRAFPVRARALTQEEVEVELALMERVKEAYFDGIKGANAAKDDIRTDLSPFQEVYEDENGQLVWARSTQDRVGHGIVPTPIEGWEDLELWRLFKSSNPNVVSHEDLRVTRQSQAKAVTVISYLSSETLGRYGALYQSDPATYAQYAALAGLYYQEVTTGDAIAPQGDAALLSVPDTMVVRGTDDPDSSLPVVETLDVSFVLTGLDGQVWIPATTYTGLDESATVYDLFAQALADNGYTAVREKGTYLVSVSGAQGTLTEKEYGQRAGWMYKVNGVIPQTYMGGCPLHDGDRVQVFYTRDASVDDPDWAWPSGPDTPTKPGHSASSQRPGAAPAENDGQEAPSAQPRPTASQVFSDVAAGSWFEGGVRFVVSRGLFQGVADGRFAPEVHLTRAMLMTVLARLDGQDTSGGEIWYQPGVDWAVAAGVSDGADPDGVITREQLAVMLYRYANAPGTPTASQDSLRGFSDQNQVSIWARDAVDWAARLGILTGKGGGILDPQGPASRAEAAVMLQRFCESLE